MALGDGGGSAGEGGFRNIERQKTEALNGILNELTAQGTTLASVLTALESLAPTTLGVSTVAGLPSAATAGQGARRLVTDANATTFASVVAGGGANIVPVYSTGAAWLIG